MVVTANMRRVLPEDKGRLAWPLRKVRLVQLLRRHNPDVVMAQECDETMFEYVGEKLGMVAVKPTVGNRVVFHRPALRPLGVRSTDLGGRSFAVAVLLSLPPAGPEAWFVTVHLNPYDAQLRARQTKALQTWLGTLQQVCPNVVIGGDFATEGTLGLTPKDVRRMVPTVGFGSLASRHTWTRKRRKAAWVDRILVSGAIRARFCTLILTDAQESDHHFPAAGLVVE